MKEKAEGDSENGDLRRQSCIFAEAMNTMKVMTGQKYGSAGFGPSAGKVQDRRGQLQGCCSVTWIWGSAERPLNV